MMNIIEKIRIKNFKRFKNFEVIFDEKMNVIIGDNEAGKSTILQAIDLVCSGSRNKIETLGLDNLFNREVIIEYLSTNRDISRLPSLEIELYLSEQSDPDLSGKNNSEKKNCCGLSLICKPNEDLLHLIPTLLNNGDNFPFEFYDIKFKTFADLNYNNYKKYIRHLSIDSSQINNESATRYYIKTIYESTVMHEDRLAHRNQYRNSKINFTKNILGGINKCLPDYKFDIRSDSKSNLGTDLTITENNVPIEHRGKGRQSTIKIEFALKRYESADSLDILLLEEPENHLSHINMKRLIENIKKTSSKQIFIATHSSLISSRLNLHNSIILNSTSFNPVLLRNLPIDTANFFTKAPDNNILEFILSDKVVLVEGDAEFIFMDILFKNSTGKSLEEAKIHIISVGGLSFKRYLDIAKLLSIKVAVIRDNDGDFQRNCIDNYDEYQSDNIKIFFDNNNENKTFEICIYNENKTACDNVVKMKKTKKKTLEYMLDNKADFALKFISNNEEIVPPKYINEACKWISK
ncbi:ATP-dependent nuclease [Providencia rettgeri]|uniref:ATP-dependent nuclease n=1 Tax=Providencia rettgeri TaxID=587 RepID=UPI00227118B0|nr:AAA family ATPase [Providencia rettgeri]MCX9115987.1 AAA family ATPase [Providencia rettgeri]